MAGQLLRCFIDQYCVQMRIDCKSKNIPLNVSPKYIKILNLSYTVNKKGQSYWGKPKLKVTYLSLQALKTKYGLFGCLLVCPRFCSINFVILLTLFPLYQFPATGVRSYDFL